MRSRICIYRRTRLKIKGGQGRGYVFIGGQGASVRDMKFLLVSAYGPMLEDCYQELSKFGKACVEFCSRESHVVAHVLARWGRENHPSVWFESPPEFSIKFLIGGVDVI